MKKHILKNSNLKIKLLAAQFVLLSTAALGQAASTGTAAVTTTASDNSNSYYIGTVLLIMFVVVLALSKTTTNLIKAVAAKNKKSSATILLMLIGFTAMAQTEMPQAKNTLPNWIFNPDLYLFGMLLFLMLYAVFVLYRVNIKLIRFLSPEAFPEKDVKVEKVKQPVLLDRILTKMNASVPLAKEEDIMLDHDYDGIKELDNNLPPWWKYGFYATIVFAFVYLIIYHVAGTGKLQLAEYNEELKVAADQKAERLKSSTDNVNEDNVVALTDASAINSGKETYDKLCVACHRVDGGGQVGPNLTDEFWLHGGGVKNIFKTITYGVPAKGMISWQSQLSPKQIQQVSSYILTLAGTNPVGPKEPQGDKWVDTTTAPSDSSKTDSLTVVQQIVSK